MSLLDRMDTLGPQGRSLCCGSFQAVLIGSEGEVHPHRVRQLFACLGQRVAQRNVGYADGIYRLPARIESVMGPETRCPSVMHVAQLGMRVFSARGRAGAANPTRNPGGFLR